MYTTSRELLARRVFYEHREEQQSGNEEKPKVEIKGERGVESIKL